MLNARRDLRIQSDILVQASCRARLDVVILFLMPAISHPLFQLCITLLQLCITLPQLRITLFQFPTYLMYI